MIRILHVVTYMGRGGLETVLMNYYRNIDRDLVQFDFLTHRDFHASYDDEIRSLGGKIFHLPRMIPWSISYLNELNSFFKSHSEYKIVHVHQDCLSSVILKVAQKNNIKVRIAHSHANGQDKDFKYPIKLFYKQNIPKYATELIACSKEAGSWMFPSSDFIVLNNAIPTHKYTFHIRTRQNIRNHFNINDDTFVIGHIARFSPAKNHPFIINIFTQLLKSNPDSVLLLVGDGDEKNTIIKQVKDLGISEKVIFAGVRNDINEVLQAFDVFIMPSRYEGLGLACIEAQASGLPCVISDTVSLECNVTDNVYRLSLDAPIDMWVSKLLDFKNFNRCDTSEQIRKSGYDITENAKWLQEHYLELWDNN